MVNYFFLSFTASLHTKKPGIKGWEIAIIVVAVVLFVAAVVAVCIYNRWHFKRKLFKKEEEIRIAYEIESHSLPQSPVKRFLAMNSVRSSSGSLTGELIFRSQVASYGDDFAHISIPLDRKWEIERKQVRIDGQLGEGAFGRVLKATAIGVPGLPQRHTVAIKTLKGKLSLLYIRCSFMFHTRMFFICYECDLGLA